jgi:hypothetical protein
MATFSTLPQKSSSHALWRNISSDIQPAAGTAEAAANPKVTVAGVEANPATGEEAGNNPNMVKRPKAAATEEVASSLAMVSHPKVAATAEAGNSLVIVSNPKEAVMEAVAPRAMEVRTRTRRKARRVVTVVVARRWGLIANRSGGKFLGQSITCFVPRMAMCWMWMLKRSLLAL